MFNMFAMVGLRFIETLHRRRHLHWFSKFLLLFGSQLRGHPLSVVRGRSFLCLCVIFIFYGFVSVGLLRATVFTASDSRDLVRASSTSDRVSLARRSDIRDRNGVILAKNLSVMSLIADPSKMDGRYVDYAIEKTLQVFPDKSPERIRALLERDSRYVLVKRDLSPRQQFAINSLGVPGYSFEPTEKRMYPKKRLFSHVLGYVNGEFQGVSGLERGYDARLAGGKGDLYLSLDERAQYILREELLRAISHYEAEGGSGLIMDVDSREVLGLVSLPDFDPSDVSDVGSETMFNRVTQGVYELGSTFKAFNTALSLESGKSLTGHYYDASRPLHVGGGYHIRDYHAKNRSMNITEIFIYSSNIGSALMAWDSGADAQKRFFGDLGLLDSFSGDYLGVSSPRYPSRWDKIAVATMSYGHGISVTPLHMANGVATIIGDGVSRLPRFVLAGGDGATGGDELERVVSDATILRMRSLFRLNVLHGSGKAAHVPGYRVGGKTGTAEKILADGSGYDRGRLISNFISVFPMDSPRYLVFVMLDEPEAVDGVSPTGGVAAAPIAGRVIERLAPLLGVIPLSPVRERLLDETLYLPLLENDNHTGETLVNASY